MHTLPFDHHTHHRRCGHARGEIEEYVQAALAQGLEEIGLSDHAPLYWREGDHPQPGSAMARSELGRYVAEVLALRRKYADRIRILLGLEADYAEGFEAAYREVRAQYPWDYWIGSVHYCQDWHIYDSRRWAASPDPEEVYADYYRLVRQSAASGLFDVLGHISGLMAVGPHACDQTLQREFEATAQAVAQSGVAIEVNTSGLRKGTGAPFPHPSLLARCLELGVPVTYGSDSHQPEEVGYGREAVSTCIREARLWRPAACGSEEKKCSVPA